MRMKCWCDATAPGCSPSRGVCSGMKRMRVTQFKKLCMNAFRALPQFRADARLSTWLYRIVTNAALMKLRSANRHPKVSLEPLLPTFAEDGHHTEPWTCCR